MLVKHIDNNTFDVFFDNGWDNWARFSHNKKEVVQIAGQAVPKAISTYLTKRYVK